MNKDLKEMHHIHKSFRKFVLGTVTVALTAVAMSTTCLATRLSVQEQIDQMLDTPFVEAKIKGGVKDLMPQGTDFRANNPSYANTRSAIYSDSYIDDTDGLKYFHGAHYPKMPMVHQYSHINASTPLSAVLSYARAPQILDDYLTRNCHDYERAYSFVVAAMPYIIAEHGYLALKPQYMVHPDSTTYYQGKEYYTEIEWTVIPGVEGQIEPLVGKFQQVVLLRDTIITHPAVQNIGDSMNLSPNVMHLKGFDAIARPDIESDFPDIPMKDMYSLVKYIDVKTGKKIVAITYHWFLPQPRVIWQKDTSEYEAFDRAFKKSNTMRQLMMNLENVDGFEDVTAELQRYMGLSKVSPIVTDTHYLGSNLPYNLEGFSGAEGTHRWTDGIVDGTIARITIPLRDGDRQVKRITFDNTTALITDKHVQNLSFILNDKKLSDIQYNRNTKSHTLEIPISPNLNGNAVITFYIPNAISPQKLGMGKDSRNLGISFADMALTYRKHAINVITHHLGQSAPYTLAGFSDAEISHRWTQENNASVTIPIEQGQKRVKSVTFKNTHAFVTEIYKIQSLTVFLNDAMINDYSYKYRADHPQYNKHTIMRPIPSALIGDAVISFIMPHAVSPKQLGTGEDPRKLGINFAEMDVAFIDK
jgi:hypothetical protein